MAGGLREVRLDGATVAEITRRDGNLRADRVMFGGGRQLHSLRYDRLGRLDKRWTSTSTALNAPALTWEGDYDDRGRLVAEHVTTGSTTDTRSYTYAEPGWLTHEQHTRSGAWSRSYGQDVSRASTPLESASSRALPAPPERSSGRPRLRPLRSTVESRAWNALMRSGVVCGSCNS